jgi:hypothetical protein
MLRAVVAGEWGASDWRVGQVYDNNTLLVSLDWGWGVPCLLVGSPP